MWRTATSIHTIDPNNNMDTLSLKIHQWAFPLEQTSKESRWIREEIKDDPQHFLRRRQTHYIKKWIISFIPPSRAMKIIITLPTRAQAFIPMLGPLIKLVKEGSSTTHPHTIPCWYQAQVINNYNLSISFSSDWLWEKR